MKKYILIENKGEIELNSFELIGASTKRDDNTKIGFFGSGLKYSIAYMLRNNIEFRIFSGELELKFTTTPEKLKDQIFERICINDKPTSYTVTMGPTWTEDWFILREIYCNALDEGNCRLEKNIVDISMQTGKTRIYIEITKSLQEIVNNWEAFFSHELQPTLEVGDVYTSYLSSECNSQPVLIYDRPASIIYRKGIRVSKNIEMLYSYNFEHIDINEDRTAKDLRAIDYAFADIVGKMPTENYVLSILRTGQDDKPCEEYRALDLTKPNSGFSSKWIKFSQDYMLVLKERSGKYIEEIMRTQKEVLYIPEHFAKALKKYLPNISILGLGRAIGDLGMTDISKTPKIDYLLKDVLKALTEMNYDVPYNISIVEFNENDVLGTADIQTKQIYLSYKLFDMGRREIALTIMEEVEHIISGKADETRAFQTHLLSSWLKTLESSHALFL